MNFVGLPWLPVAKSDLLYGVGDNAHFVAKHMMGAHYDLRAGLVRAA